MQMPKAAVSAVEAFDRLLPDDPRVSRRVMFGHPAAFANGYLFLGVFGADLFVRVPPDRIEATLRRPGFRRFEPMAGRAMTGYVVLPEEVVVDPGAAGPWVQGALAAATSLPPKLPKTRARGSAPPTRRRSR